MEKTNKYYKIIENLVIQNKKYPGLESILEEIIDALIMEDQRRKLAGEEE